VDIGGLLDMEKLFEENLWADFSYTDLTKEIRRVRSMTDDLIEREYKSIVAFFKKKGIIPKLLSKNGNMRLFYDLGHDNTFCQDMRIARDKFDNYVNLINLAIARLYYKSALEYKVLECVNC
jgi:hypothetical protein